MEDLLRRAILRAPERGPLQAPKRSDPHAARHGVDGVGASPEGDKGHNVAVGAAYSGD
ncbi:hypothetical protein GCM10009826_42860 [Humibacillus xanthopallidus]